MRLSVTTGRREKWREKDKTQDWAPVDDRRMESFCASVEVLKPRSWEPNIEVLKPRSWEPNIEVLKPRSWEPNATTRACRHERIVSYRHGYPLVCMNKNYRKNLHLQQLAITSHQNPTLKSFTSYLSCMNTTIFYKTPAMSIQPQNKQMKYHKQMPMWIKQSIVKQIQPLLLTRSNSHWPFGVEA
jgi:hypothetical protein